MADKTILVGTTVSFQDKSNDATITSYTWNFGIYLRKNNQSSFNQFNQ